MRVQRFGKEGEQHEDYKHFIHQALTILSNAASHFMDERGSERETISNSEKFSLYTLHKNSLLLSEREKRVHALLQIDTLFEDNMGFKVLCQF